MRLSSNRGGHPKVTADCSVSSVSRTWEYSDVILATFNAREAIVQRMSENFLVSSNQIVHN